MLGRVEVVAVHLARGRVGVRASALRVRVRVAARVLGRVRVGVRIRELGQGKGRSGLG